MFFGATSGRKVHNMDPIMTRPDSDTETTPTGASGGTQSLERALALLRAVASHGAEGARLADLMGLRQRRNDAHRRASAPAAVTQTATDHDLLARLKTFFSL